MSENEPVNAKVQPSPLKQLIDVWERVCSWGEQDLFLQFGEDLCGLGRYITARTFHERVFRPNGPEALVVIDRAKFERIVGAAIAARNEWGAESRVGLWEGDLDDYVQPTAPTEECGR